MRKTIFCFVGFSVLLAPVLKAIPIAVLFGVFVYLGTISLSGNQFIIRMVMFFMPPKHYPDFRFVRKVKYLMIIQNYVKVTCVTCVVSHVRGYLVTCVGI